jgi:hypothetical protein
MYNDPLVIIGHLVPAHTVLWDCPRPTILARPKSKTQSIIQSTKFSYSCIILNQLVQPKNAMSLEQRCNLSHYGIIRKHKAHSNRQSQRALLSLKCSNAKTKTMIQSEL